MLRVPTEIVQPGMILAKPVTDERGQILLRQSLALTYDYISILKRRGVNSVFIRDNDMDDVIAEDVLADEIRNDAQAALALVGDFVQEISKDIFEATREVTLANIQEPGIVNVLRNHDSFKQLERAVQNILDNLIETDVLLNISQIRNHDRSLFTHSVNVAIIALIIGKQLNLNQQDLEQLGTGAMLHDIGKIFLDPMIIYGQQSSSLSLAKQHTLRCEHPRLGYELLRTRNPDANMVNQVALEHHERQDGQGYPCGLRGTNKIERSFKDPNNIKLITEITTVADVYDILSLEKLDEPALTPHQIADTMQHLAGTFLNREITRLFLLMLPSLPKGIGVIVNTGRYAGYKGVVIQANKKQPERPLVRLLYNSQNERITPIELDTAREPWLNIEATLSL